MIYTEDYNYNENDNFTLSTDRFLLEDLNESLEERYGWYYDTLSQKERNFEKSFKRWSSKNDVSEVHTIRFN